MNCRQAIYFPRFFPSSFRSLSNGNELMTSAFVSPAAHRPVLKHCQRTMVKGIVGAQTTPTRRSPAHDDILTYQLRSGYCN